MKRRGRSAKWQKKAWRDASEEWSRYGEEPLPSSLRHKDDPDKPVSLRLGDLALEEQTAADLLAQLEAMQPGLRDEIVAEKRATLSDSQREALDTPPEKRTGHQFQLAQEATKTTAVTHNEVARRITGPKRKEALALAEEIREHETLAKYIRRYRSIVNFEYWEKRARIEQDEVMRDARRLIFKGDQAFAEGSLIDARDAYREGMENWRTVLDANPELVSDQTLGEYLLEVCDRYRRILGQLDDPFPENFILQDVIDAQRERYGAPAVPAGPAESEPAKGEAEQ